MPFRPRCVASAIRTCLLTAMLCLAASVPVIAQAQQGQQAEARKKLQDVQRQIEAASKRQAATAARRTELNAQLAEQAAKLSRAVRAVRDTDARIATGEQQLQQLRARRAEVQEHLQRQRAAVADLLRATYALDHGSDLRLLLDDEDVARMARALVYSRYFQEDRERRMRALLADLDTLQQTEAEITAQQAALQADKAEREKQAQTLAAQRDAQKKLAAQADAEYQSEADKVAALQRDAKTLDQLIARLQRAIAQAARGQGKESRTSAAGPGDMGGANIRGNLPWPANGDVHSYGNGVLIKAPGGSEVRAVASGKIIYAGFLRGYGLLLIINHGNGWMSMYGNNEALLHEVGAKVAAGTVIATASAPTGVNTGEYFEMRKDGKPVDPRQWLRRQL
jgi:septal ring factor EnvC (AmiA/AmiB activator)